MTYNIILLGDYMEYIKIILRVCFFYAFIIVIYRMMGKREVGQLGIIDLIVSILIAELVTISVEDSTKNILSSVIPIIALVTIQISLSYLSLKSEEVRTILDGKPSHIIKNGQINYHEMLKQKYNLDDLLTQLREKGYRNIEEVEYAILENSGTLSVFPYNKSKEKTPIPMALILDGNIQKETLKLINRNEQFVLNLLDKNKLKLKEIFYAFYKDKNIFVIKYSDLKK